MARLSAPSAARPLPIPAAETQHFADGAAWKPGRMVFLGGTTRDLTRAFSRVFLFLFEPDGEGPDVLIILFSCRAPELGQVEAMPQSFELVLGQRKAAPSLPDQCLAFFPAVSFPCGFPVVQQVANLSPTCSFIFFSSPISCSSRLSYFRISDPDRSDRNRDRPSDPVRSAMSRRRGLPIAGWVSPFDPGGRFGWWLSHLTRGKARKEKGAPSFLPVAFLFSTGSHGLRLGQLGAIARRAAASFLLLDEPQENSGKATNPSQGLCGHVAVVLCCYYCLPLLPQSLLLSPVAQVLPLLLSMVLLLLLLRLCLL